ncbi:hypothetical protein [Rhodococcoides fascians]|uniref:hypothetical protein n=1 Tax=Rhodococcoides fascians TaxID=1828 RepID=UPI00050C9EB3|nr:hypothetical protein [Rhodococcus fascians]
MMPRIPVPMANAVSVRSARSPVRSGVRSAHSAGGDGYDPGGDAEPGGPERDDRHRAEHHGDLGHLSAGTDASVPPLRRQVVVHIVGIEIRGGDSHGSLLPQAG